MLCVGSSSGRLRLSVLLNHGIQLRTTARSIDRALQLFLAGGEIVTPNDRKRLPHGIVIDGSRNTGSINKTEYGFS